MKTKTYDHRSVKYQINSDRFQFLNVYVSTQLCLKQKQKNSKKKT